MGAGVRRWRFALLQGLDLVAQRFGWPEQFIRIAIVVVAIGFFIMLALAWYHGERGAQRVSGSELLILALLLAIGCVVLWRIAQNSNAPSATVATPPAAGAPAPSQTPSVPVDHKSIAVLPFVNMSSDKEQEYFSDGISEELLNLLAKIPALHAARTSSFSFKGKDVPIPEIANCSSVARAPSCKTACNRGRGSLRMPCNAQGDAL